MRCAEGARVRGLIRVVCSELYGPRRIVRSSPVDVAVASPYVRAMSAPLVPEATLRVAPNCHLRMEALHLPVADFPRVSPKGAGVGSD